MRWAAAIRKEIMEQWRTSRLLVLLVVLGFFGMASPLMAKFMPELIAFVPGGEQFAMLIPTPTIQDAFVQYVKNTSQFAVLLAIFLSMGAVVQEKERGTAVMMLSKPLERGTFLLSKFVAIAFSFLVSLLVAGVLGYYYTVFLFQAPDAGQWLALNLLIWLYCLVYIAITLLGSTLARSQAVAVGVGFGALLVLALFGSFPAVNVYLPAQLITWSGELFSHPGVQYWSSVWISLGIIVACLLAAWLSFRKQEL